MGSLHFCKKEFCFTFEIRNGFVGYFVVWADEHDSATAQCQYGDD